MSTEKRRGSVFEQMTVLNLVKSLRSNTCPACGRWKKEDNTLCVECYRKLPKELQGRLYRKIEQGYDREVFAAFRFLNRHEFILPELNPIKQWPVRPLALTVEIARLIVLGEICPRDADIKPPGAVFCPRCWQLLEVEFSRMEHNLFVNRKVREPMTFAVWRKVVSLEGLTHAPDVFLEELHHGMRVMKAKVYHYKEAPDAS
jgi:hypothetical protein